MSTFFAYLSSAELTDVGRRRKNNEDSLIRIPEAGLYCVADGMGGVQGGEIASKACVDSLKKEFSETPEAVFAVTAEASARLVERALNAASKWVKERAESLGFSGTGSTAVALVFDRVTPSRGMALHAGDSRAYRWRADKLIQLTADHSVAAAAGLPDDSSLPPMFRGVITRAVGLTRHVELESTPFDVAAGDLFLLCSDGLSKMVNDRRIQKLLRKHQEDPLEELAEKLVAEALEEGGDDNVTVIVIRVARELPVGPTMEIPPETRALEAMAPVHEPSPARPVEEEHDATGQTADGDGPTARTMADGEVTPSNNRMEGRTPSAPDADGKPATPTTPMPRSDPPSAIIARSDYPSPAGGLRGIFVVLLLAVLAGAAIWGVMEWRAGQRAEAARPTGTFPVPGSDPQHGTPE